MAEELSVRIAARAQEGEANAELVDYVATVRALHLSCACTSHDHSCDHLLPNMLLRHAGAGSEEALRDARPRE